MSNHAATLAAAKTADEFAALFVADRRTARRAKTHNGRGDAIARGARVIEAARRAGFTLDVIALDERARVEVYG